MNQRLPPLPEQKREKYWGWHVGRKSINAVDSLSFPWILSEGNVERSPSSIPLLCFSNQALSWSTNHRNQLQKQCIHLNTLFQCKFQSTWPSGCWRICLLMLDDADVLPPCIFMDSESNQNQGHSEANPRKTDSTETTPPGLQHHLHTTAGRAQSATHWAS